MLYTGPLQLERGVGEQRHGLYYLLRDSKFSTFHNMFLEPQLSALNTSSSHVPYDLWHACLGHPFDDKLAVLNKDVPNISCFWYW